MTGKIVKVISPPSSSIYLTRYEIDGELGEWLKENTENPTGFDILAANAARNAKFKVGDKVKLSDSHPRFPGRDAVVTRVFPTGFIKVKVDGAEDIEVAKRLISANSRSRNAVVQKALNAVARNRRDSFAVFGDDQPIRYLRWDDALSCIDEVKARAVRDWNIKLPETFNLTCGGKFVGQFKIDTNGNVYRNADTSVLRETAVNSELVNLWHVMDDAKKIAEEGHTNHNVKSILRLAISAAEKEEPGHPSIKEAKKILSMFNSSRSTNSVVAKAMNASRVARNFTPQSEFEVGDIVRFRDSVRSVPHDEKYKVVKVSGDNITIKGGRDNSTSVEFKNNLEIV